MIWTDVRIPLLGWFGWVVGLLLIAQFQAFHQLLGEQHEEGAVRAEDRNQTYAVRGTYPLESAFSVHDYGRPLDPAQKGFVMRCVVARAHSGRDLELTSAIKTHLREAMRSSRLDSWIQSSFFREASAAPWELSDPTGLTIATVKRRSPQRISALDIRAEASLQLPSAPMHLGWVALVIDVVALPGPNVGRAFSGLTELFKLMDVLIQSATEVGASTVSMVLGETTEDLTGPSITARTSRGELADFIAFPEFERATGASGRGGFALSAKWTREVKDREARSAFIKAGLARMLAAEGFVNFEHDLDGIGGP